MFVTVSDEEGRVTSIEVDDAELIENVKALLEVEVSAATPGCAVPPLKELPILFFAVQHSIEEPIPHVQWSGIAQWLNPCWGRRQARGPTPGTQGPTSTSHCPGAGKHD